MTPKENAVVTECELPQAPDKVWKALTVPKLLAAWLPDAVNSEILAAEPNRLLRYRWPGKEEDRDAKGQTVESVVTFELTGTSAGGTHLRVVHRVTGVSNIVSLKRRAPVAMAGAHAPRRRAIGASRDSLRCAPVTTLANGSCGLRRAA
jgi:uncharacterized protein YndB with AHSA1/START domain